MIEGRERYDAESFLYAVKQSVVGLLSSQEGIKVKLVPKCNMERTSIKTGVVITEPADFHSKIEVNLEGTDTSELYTGMVDKVLKSMTTFQRRGSGWRFKSLISLDILTVKYEPLKGSSYIPLPSVLNNKKAIINLKNEDDECFKWCVTRAINLVEKNVERISRN